MIKNGYLICNVVAKNQRSMLELRKIEASKTTSSFITYNLQGTLPIVKTHILSNENEKYLIILKKNTNVLEFLQINERESSITSVNNATLYQGGNNDNVFSIVDFKVVEDKIIVNFEH